jgi:hypothetical protein
MKKTTSKPAQGEGTVPRKAPVPTVTEVTDLPDEAKKPGRPKAKHSDKLNYAQMSLYIRREIRNRTKVRLFEQGGEFSALVEMLLETWLKEQDQLAGVR